MTLDPEQPTATPTEAAPWPGPLRKNYVQDDPRLRSPVVATLLSALPGLGQVYLGYYQQGFVHILVVGSLVALLAHDVGDLTPLLGIFLAFFWLYNMVDAGRRATFLNLAIHRIETPDLPEGFGTIGFRGQVAGALALIVAGTLALAHVRFGLSLAWIGKWWPAGLVGLGVYLLWNAAADRRK